MWHANVGMVTVKIMVLSIARFVFKPMNCSDACLQTPEIFLASKNLYKESSMTEINILFITSPVPSKHL